MMKRVVFILCLLIAGCYNAYAAPCVITTQVSIDKSGTLDHNLTRFSASDFSFKLYNRTTGKFADATSLGIAATWKILAGATTLAVNLTTFDQPGQGGWAVGQDMEIVVTINKAGDALDGQSASLVFKAPSGSTGFYNLEAMVGNTPKGIVFKEQGASIAVTGATICEGNTSADFKVTITSAPANYSVTWKSVDWATTLGTTNKTSATTSFTETVNGFGSYTANANGTPKTYNLHAILNDGTSNVDTADFILTVNKTKAEITPSAPEGCEGSSLTLTAKGGGSYKWIAGSSNSNNTVTIASLAAADNNKEYKVEVTKNGCKDTASVTLKVNPKPTITDVTTPDPDVCDGTAITLTANGATGGTGTLSYVWTGATGVAGTATATVNVPVNQQTYKVKVKDSKNCESSEVSVKVTGHKIEATPSTPTVCKGAAATLDANAVCTPALTGADKPIYTWGPVGDINGASNGASITTVALNTVGTKTFTLTVEDPYGCTDTKSATVTVENCGTGLHVAVNNANPSGCANATVSLGLTASGGNCGGAYNVVWTPDAGLTINGTGTNVTASAATAGTYNVSAKITCGAEDTTVQMAVKIAAIPTLANIKATPSTINVGQSSTLTVDPTPGDATCQWTGTPLATSIGKSVSTGAINAPGKYVYSVTASKDGCTSLPMTDTVIVNGGGPVSGQLALSVDNACANSGNSLTITMTASGGDTYSFELRDKYNVVVKTVTNEAGPSWTYLVAAADEGTYKVTNFKVTKDGTTVNGTINPSQIDAKFWATPNVNAAATATLTHCLGDVFVLKASGDAGLTYTWDNGVNDGVPFTPSSTTYTVTGTDAHGCQNTSQVAVTVNPKPTVTVPANIEICRGDEVILNATGTGDVYTWNNGVTNGVPFKPTMTSKYTATGMFAATGCKDTASMMVIVNQPPQIVRTSKKERNIAIGKDVYFALDAVGKNMTYQWYKKENGIWTAMVDMGNMAPTINGSQTDSICLKTVPESWDGSEFKCVVTGNCGSDSTTFKLGVRECFDIQVALKMGEGIMPDEVAGDQIDGWYCIGTRIAIHALVTSDEGYEIENPRYTWTIDGLPAQKVFETDSSVLSWVPEFYEDDIVVKVCVYSDGACEEVCAKWLRLKARPFEDVSVGLLTSVDWDKRMFCPGDTVTCWATSKNAGDQVKYHWYNDIFDLSVEESPKNKVIHLENGKVVMVMGQEDTWMRVVMTPSPGVCTKEKQYVDTAFLKKKQVVVPSLYIDCKDTVACKGDIIPMQAVYQNVGTKPTFQWQRSIGYPFPDWDLGTNSYASVKLDEEDVWVKCTMKPSQEVCYMGKDPIVAAIQIRVLKEEGSITITSDMEYKEPGDELVFESEVKNILGNRVYEWWVNNNLTPVNEPEYVSSILRPGDLVYATVSGERVCQTRIKSNEITVRYGMDSRDTLIVIYKNQTIKNVKMAKKGDNNCVFFTSVNALYGMAIMMPNGHFSYVPNRGFVGSDYVEYKVVNAKTGATEIGHIYITVKDEEEFFVPNIITPNGDNINDYWDLSGFIDKYPEHVVTIYNRSGAVVFQTKSYDNKWNGQGDSRSGNISSVRLPSGIYSYVIYLGEGKSILKSWLEIRTEPTRTTVR